jgi:hypothetical protein
MQLNGYKINVGSITFNIKQKEPGSEETPTEGHS